MQGATTTLLGDGPFAHLGCVEKLENTKSNYGYSYFIAPWYVETEKT